MIRYQRIIRARLAWSTVAEFVLYECRLIRVADTRPKLRCKSNRRRRKPTFCRESRENSRPPRRRRRQFTRRSRHPRPAIQRSFRSESADLAPALSTIRMQTYHVLIFVLRAERAFLSAQSTSASFRSIDTLCRLLPLHFFSFRGFHSIVAV